MRIGINVIPLRPNEMGGAEIYFRDLLAELCRRGEHEIVLVTADDNHESLDDFRTCRRVLFAHGSLAGLRRRARRLPRPLRTAVEAGVRLAARGLAPSRRRRSEARSESLRDLIKREQLDLWFCPFTQLEPRRCPVPTVITVYDLQHEHFREFFDRRELEHRQSFYADSCRAADRVVAISAFTRREIIEAYGVPEERVTSIPLAVGANFEWQNARAQCADVRRRYALPARYVFYPANSWHHKNHVRLITAMAEYRRHYRDPLTLVLTGRGMEGDCALRAAIEREGLGNLVRVLGYVARADLPSLYAGAICLVFPSLFEGFGLPLVEAMQLGCPIAAANAASIPEVVGDAAVLFDPLDARDMARALAAIARDPDTASDLARRGRIRAARFSIARMAEDTAQVFARLHRDASVGQRGVR
ncbi:MAG: hypothetical protein DMD81_02775 [Candidatus Rokuibacteriota bacterium]|nr:MAG: hypothetical protein DMD81_02775 [Candidatus Rokubacteria bacterium]